MWIDLIHAQLIVRLEVATFVQEKLIHPVIYINSMRVHACELEPNDDGFDLYVAGYCYLQAYWDAHESIIGIFENLIFNPPVTISTAIFMERFLEQPQLQSWQINNNFFKKVPLNRLRLQKDEENSKIGAFVLLDPLNIENIRITHEDFLKIKNYYIEKFVTSTIEQEKTAKLNKKLKKIQACVQNGKKSGQFRSQVAIENWNGVKIQILSIAKNNQGETPNKVATIAAKKGIINHNQTSNIAKKIRDEKEFDAYLKKK